MKVTIIVFELTCFGHYDLENLILFRIYGFDLRYFAMKGWV